MPSFQPYKPTPNKADKDLGQFKVLNFLHDRVQETFTYLLTTLLMRIAGAEDDDFIRTISDDDEIVQSSVDSEDLELGSLTQKPQNSRKRKRSKDQGEIFPDAADGTYEKNKIIKRRKNRLRAAVKDNRLMEEEEGETWTAHGEDDGALDSDFEFQIGDIDNWVTEDLDGWDLKGNAAAIKLIALGDKRGVDIDAIIARRGKRDSIAENGDSNHTKSEDESHRESGLDEVTDSEADGRGIEEGEDENEDQTLDEDAFGMGVADTEEEERDDSLAEDQIPESSSDEESVAKPVPHPDDLDSHASSADEMDVPEEQARRKAFFAPEETEITSKGKNKNTTAGSFQSMSLSRPILRGLAAMGFSEPTPIQTKTIPVALLGKDVVGGAVTGSGKTAAFIIPILERLLYRPKKIPTSRVAILMPTRELAVQCFNVAKKLASFTDVTFCQLVGGFSLREQESVLRQRPDVMIATPGRFIDHMRNSASFTVDTLEILVLDEADRMLEDGFADELNEILTTIPKSRQTMLFSATMTDRVDKLIRVGLNRPVRLMVDSRKQTVVTLIQEFVRLRPGREDRRLGYLMYLCQNIYTDHTIIFFRQKKLAHRVRIIFGLFGIKAAELHGSMSQEQRISALASFRTSQTTHLLATDLASRGLDIPTVTTVINYEAPQTHEIYLHRVGRTARAGRAGRACTIAAEPDRKIVKQAVKAGRAQGAKIVSRVIEPSLADDWAAKCAALDAEVDSILEEEKEEKALAGAEMQVRKGENIMTHENDIKSRPKRTWFESEKEKLVAKKKGMVELNGAVGLGKKIAGGKLSHNDKKRLDDGRERKEGRVWKKGRGDGVDVGPVGKAKWKDRGGSVSGRKGKGGKEGGGKAKKVKGGGRRR